MIFTIGHSTRPLAEFIDLLRAHGVLRLADVRTVPQSRRHPHFAGEALAASLAQAGIEYRHFPDLGGLRKPRPDSANGAWRVAGFRGYADYMETPAFANGLEKLIAFARVRDGRDVRGSGVVAMSPTTDRRCAGGARHRGATHHLGVGAGAARA